MQHTLQRMLEHRASVEKVTGVKVLEGCLTKSNSKQRETMFGALKDLALQLPSRKIVDVVKTVLRTQRSCLDLFENVHRLDGNLQSAVSAQRGSK